MDPGAILRQWVLAATLRQELHFTCEDSRLSVAPLAQSYRLACPVDAVLEVLQQK